MCCDLLKNSYLCMVKQHLNTSNVLVFRCLLCNTEIKKWLFFMTRKDCKCHFSITNFTKDKVLIIQYGKCLLMVILNTVKDATIQ